jgi:serine/threonine protein phosphatase PrpC
MRSVGVEATVEADASTLTLQEGDTVLLCSDGLSGYIDGDTLVEYLKEKSPSQAVLDLVDAANDAGGKDNITALVLQIRRIGPYEDTREEVVST